MPDEGMESYDGLSDRAGSPAMHMDQEKRIRREIANSNERRRMQSINAGFQSLRTLLPHHEGEKLSKAAILQQTAEYIYTLEQEKTRLLSQNCQLKRLLNQQEGEASNVTVNKKRKTDSGAVTVSAPVSESSDEGIGSMSPEPVNIATTTIVAAPVQSSEQESATETLRRELMDLRLQLDRERRLRIVLEDQFRSLENQVCPDRVQQVQLQYHHDTQTWPEEAQLDIEMYPEPKEEVDMGHPMLHQAPVECESVPVSSLPPRRESQCSSHSSSRLLQEEEQLSQMQTSTIVSAQSIMFVDPEESPIPLALPVKERSSPCPSPGVAPSSSIDPLSPSASAHEPRITSALEAAIKADPKVEVQTVQSLERLPSPSCVSEDSSQSRLYLANTSRQNLETIVEAIRHLEGDGCFGDDPSPHRHMHPNGTQIAVIADRVQERLQGCPEPEAQDMPLALTTSSRVVSHQSTDHQRLIKMKMDPFHYQRTTLQQQQQRPGVIVVKQHT